MRCCTAATAVDESSAAHATSPGKLAVGAAEWAASVRTSVKSGSREEEEKLRQSGPGRRWGPNGGNFRVWDVPQWARAKLNNRGAGGGGRGEGFRGSPVELDGSSW